ncbi:MAG: hypothetical protein NC483_03355 [Ruminococcus sp.]|nr:hypothetical protein [Ruminococcus sp.]
MREFIKEHRKIILLIDGILIILMFALLILVVSLNSGGSNKRELEKELEKLGKDFYENEYYPLLSDNTDERINFLKSTEKSGIKISLENIKSYNKDKGKEITNFVNSDTKEACDAKRTRVIITPKDNYSKTSYDIKVELHCGF